MADLILKLLPANKKAKEAFVYYRDGMSAQTEGEYAEALENYEEALKLEEDSNDRGYILYNMGLIYASNGDRDKALELYHQAIEYNPRLPQALNNIAVIFHYQGEKAKEAGDQDGGEVEVSPIHKMSASKKDTHGIPVDLAWDPTRGGHWIPMGGIRERAF